MRNRLRGDFAVTKAIASIEPGPDDETGPGTFSLILSTDDVDRDGEIVDKGAFDPLPDHIAMDIDHGMSVATTVASGRPFYRPDGKLQVDGSFASTELGQNTRTLVREGHIRTASVAMIPTKKSKDEDGTTRIIKADLLNGAFTPVPSNRSATVLSAKSATKVLEGVDSLMKAGARNSAGDKAIVQAIHDLVSNLGALCGNGSSEEGGSSGDPDNDGDPNGVEKRCVADGPIHYHVKNADGTTECLAPGVKTTEATTPEVDAEIESKSAAEAAAVKAAAEAADSATDLDAVVWSLVADALNAGRDL